LLKSLPDTKVIAVGIGSEVDESELQIIASSPEDVIVVPSFNSLTSIEERLLNESCTGKTLVIRHRAKLSVTYLTYSLSLPM